MFLNNLCKIKIVIMKNLKVVKKKKLIKIVDQLVIILSEKQ